MSRFFFICSLAIASSVVSASPSHANVRKQNDLTSSRLSKLKKLATESRHKRLLPKRHLALQKAQEQLKKITSSPNNDAINQSKKSLAKNARKQRELTERIDVASTLKLRQFLEIQDRKQVLKHFSALKDFIILKPLLSKQSNLLEQSKRLQEQIDTLNIPLEKALAQEHLAKIELEKPAAFELNVRLAKLNQHLVSERKIPREEIELHREASKAWQVKGFVTSKPNKISQDAYAANPIQGRFAIADGVSKSLAPEYYSQALTRGWTKSPFWQAKTDDVDNDAFYSWMDHAGERWHKLAPSKAKKISSSRRKSIPNGSSTFVGVDVIARQGKHFLRPILVGDSALFVVRGSKVVFKSHELKDVESPATSALTAGGDFEHQLEIFEPVEVLSGDKIYMATDAVAKWVLEELQKGSPPFHTLDNIKDINQWRQWVEGSRLTKELDVDDSTLLTFTVPKDLGALN